MTIGVFSPEMFLDMRKKVEEPRLAEGPFSSMFGVQFRSSPIFPFEDDCAACGGSGEGATSTYCPKCKGGGKLRVLGGIFERGKSVVAIEYLPKKFAVSFPAGLVPAGALCRGLV